MNPIRVAIYSRVSTAEQAMDGFSIEAQISSVRAVCEARGKVIAQTYIDKGISGKSMKNRPALLKMLEDAKEGKFDEVAVWKLSRLARNNLDLLKIVDILNKHEVNFTSITESFDTSTPAGKLQMNILGVISEFERETIVENVKLGMKQRAKEGKWNGGRLLGYKSVKLEEGKSNETGLVIIPEEAEIVRKIFTLYSQGKGLKSIANHLNKCGYKTIKGNSFSTAAISVIIRNPTYIGKIRFNKYIDWSGKRRKGKNEDYILADGQHEPIIDKELWDKVQELIQMKSFKPKRTYDGEYPLTGLLKCPVCGASMVAARTVNKRKSGKKYIIRYYYCGEFRSKGATVCKSNSVRADDAEKYVFERIKEVLGNDKVLRDIVKRINESKDKNIKPLQHEAKVIMDKLDILNDKHNKVFELYEDGIIDKGKLAERLKNIQEEIKVCSARKEEIDKELSIQNVDKVPFEVVKNAMMEFNDILESSNKEDKKILLQMMIDKITIRDRKDVSTMKIHFNSNLLEEFSSDDGNSSFYVNFRIAI
ncbi:recombinase family protein [Paramaledivibacter caminithermalis]|uniref:Site-specific DNA recombinase n=1 Tax=Paramaledivibacter caminithermalis (strain DSM 15212 / CIP 107654 / DViRD3) TaxID=1121301 RepID=A0A1M6NAI1_PARC5|nr:recombinase family protein [Paramaledivibacter caminithermalis]SHJ92701.1 site-specific DNA recombinase [Paramaledivibacter caminithermalis DSM 15212]